MKEIQDMYNWPNEKPRKKPSESKGIYLSSEGVTAWPPSHWLSESNIKPSAHAINESEMLINQAHRIEILENEVKLTKESLDGLEIYTDWLMQRYLNLKKKGAKTNGSN